MIGEQLSLEHEENLKLKKLNTKKKTKVIIKDHDKKLHKEKQRPSKYYKKNNKDQHKDVYIEKNGKKKGYTKNIYKSANEEVGIVNTDSKRYG